MVKDPRYAIRTGAMSKFQIWIVALSALIAVLDGFDVVVMAYVAPAIAKDWNLSGATLGALFSAGLIGLALGAFFLAPSGDRYGRRPVVLTCLLLMLLSMLGSAFARNYYELFIARVVTGIGVGAALATINIVVVEYSNDRRRTLCTALMGIGYPVGATLGGIVSIYLMKAYGWRAPFYFGVFGSISLFPLVWARLPESLEFLIERHPKGALNKVNRILPRLKLEAITALPISPKKDRQSTGMFALFGGAYKRRFLAASAAYFCVMMTFYFVASWTPKILTDAGLSLSGAISGAVLLSIGGIIGALTYGFLASRWGARQLAVVIFIGLFGMMFVFSSVNYDPMMLTWVALTLGFFHFAALVALYVLVPAVFPAELRGTALGLAMGVGRIGAAVGPFIAGLLIEAGWHRSEYFLVLAVPILVAAMMLSFVRGESDLIPSTAD